MKLSEFSKNARNTYKLTFFEMSYIIEKVTKITTENQLSDCVLSEKNIDEIMSVISEYTSGKPLNKIFHEQCFCGIDFYIDENVLAPRPETEILVSKAVESIQNKVCNVLDICTGSGCIGITIKKLCPFVNMTMTDISPDALKVAKINAENIVGGKVNIIESDMFKNIPVQKFDYIVSNPPYIRNDDNSIGEEVLKFDPHIALFGGDDGLKFYRIILDNSEKYLNENGKIFLEIGYDIYENLVELIKTYNYNIQTIKDYSGINRVLILCKGR